MNQPKAPPVVTVAELAPVLQKMVKAIVAATERNENNPSLVERAAVRAALRELMRDCNIRVVANEDQIPGRKHHE